VFIEIGVDGLQAGADGLIMSAGKIEVIQQGCSTSLVNE